MNLCYNYSLKSSYCRIIMVHGNECCTRLNSALQMLDNNMHVDLRVLACKIFNWNPLQPFQKFLKGNRSILILALLLVHTKIILPKVVQLLLVQHFIAVLIIFVKTLKDDFWCLLAEVRALPNDRFVSKLVFTSSALIKMELSEKIRISLQMKSKN